MKRCWRQCIEVCSADQSAQSAEKIFRLHFSLLKMGSRGTFALCTASSRCTRIAGPRAAMSFCLEFVTPCKAWGNNSILSDTHVTESYSPSCTQCLQTNSACGWCIYNNVCSGTPVRCSDETNWYQVSQLHALRCVLHFHTRTEVCSTCNCCDMNTCIVSLHTAEPWE